MDTLPATGATPAGGGWLARRARPGLLLGLMLLVLHAALVFGMETPAARALMLAHFGLFLLWQPLWSGSTRLVDWRILPIVAGAALLAWWGSWWLAGLWMALLLSLLGGSLPGLRRRGERFVPLLAAVYLLGSLLVWVVPQLVWPGPADPVQAFAMQVVLPAPVLLILLLPGPVRHRSQPAAVDLLYGFLLFLLVLVLMLGAVFVQQVGGAPWPLALAQTVLGMAAVLVALSWLWDVRGGFEGLGQALSRYFLGLGVPFEQWMHSLANLAESETDPGRLVAAAARELLALPWIEAVEWRCGDGDGLVGEPGRQVSRFRFRGLELALHTRRQPGPGLWLHMRLLARLLADYHDAKVRERAQRSLAWLAAVHETGSRVTHDVKNLLQSLQSLCAAAESCGEDESEALRGLMRRQLPQITRRLQSTLGKLQGDTATGGEQMPALDWWQALRQAHAHEAVTFAPPSLPDAVQLPIDLFDSVCANLLQNALEKRRRGEASRISVALEAASEGRCRLRVEDDGPPVEGRLAQRLFVEPVESDSGLGVGLYQSARQAAAAGYRLVLAENGTTGVAFVLEPLVGPRVSQQPTGA